MVNGPPEIGASQITIGFAFDEVQTVEQGDFFRDSVPMSFDQHSSLVVLDMMRSMSYMHGMGLGRRRQHGRSEFIIVLDHDPPFDLDLYPWRQIFDAWHSCSRRRSNLDFITFHLTILFVLAV